MNRHIAIRKEKGQVVHSLIAWLCIGLFIIPFSAFSQEISSGAVSLCDTTNELDYGGSKTSSAKVVFESQKVDFTVPPVPTGSYDPDSGELILFDTSGQPHVIATWKNEGESIFPIIIEDAEGNKYQIDTPSEEGTESSGGASDSGGGKQEPIINRDYP